MKKPNKKFKISIISIIIATVVYIVLDYMNLPHILGFNFSNINTDLLNLIFNSFIVVLLYLITYFTIDKKQMEKEYNAKRTACILISSSYTQCQETISLFDNNEMISKYIVPKVDFNQFPSDNPVMQRLQNNPFTEYEHILQLAENGYIDDKRLETYINFIANYKSYISLKITFCDINNPQTIEQSELKTHIENSRNSLLNTIKDELGKLNYDKE